MKYNIHGFTSRQFSPVKPCMLHVFHSNFAAFIVCRRYKPCEFPRFVWTDCWGNKSHYVITSPANSPPKCATPLKNYDATGFVTVYVQHIMVMKLKKKMKKKNRDVALYR